VRKWEDRETETKKSKMKLEMREVSTIHAESPLSLLVEGCKVSFEHHISQAKRECSHSCSLTMLDL
jgi:hypothetical protein